MNRDQNNESVDVVPIIFPGLVAFDYYSLADEIVELNPDVVVLAVNLASIPRKTVGAGDGLKSEDGSRPNELQRRSHLRSTPSTPR